jgi:hypothetical protein
MEVGRIIRNGNGFEWVALTEKDEQEIRTEVRERNLAIYRRCLTDARALVVRGPTLLTADDMKLIVRVAAGLFEKEGIDCWAALAGLLQRKVFWMKERSPTMEAAQV